MTGPTRGWTATTESAIVPAGSVGYACGKKLAWHALAAVHVALVYENGDRGPLFRVSDGKVRAKVTKAGTVKAAWVQLDDGTCFGLMLTMVATVRPGDTIEVELPDDMVQESIEDVRGSVDARSDELLADLLDLSQMLRRMDVA